MTIPVKLVVGLVLLGAVCALEVYLSRRKAWWPGVVLPGLWLAYTLLATIAAALDAAPLTAGLVAELLCALLTSNIPTLVLLGLYALCRSRQRRQRQLERMQAQDL